MAHAGSWLGLPDFGITEGIQSWLAPSSNLTAQGGSNLRGLSTGSAYSTPSPSLNYTPINASYGTPDVGSGTGTGTGGTGTGTGSVLGLTDGGTGGGTPTGPDYSSYYNYLDSMESALPGQRSTQEQIARNSADMQTNTLSNNFTQNKDLIEQGGVKALTDITNALKQQWQQGNTMLGTRGASDSSAAKQYSYALAKQGSQQRGDIMQEISNRQLNLKRTYDTETQNIAKDLENNMLSIGQWFAEAQNQIRGMRADQQLQASQQAFDYAMQLAQTKQAEFANRRNVLDTWAANKAQTLPQLTQMLAQNAANLPTFQGMNGNIYGGGGSGPSLIGSGANTEEDKNPFMFNA